MKPGLSFLSLGVLGLAALLMLPGTARADARPNFDDDATPILRVQPGLLEYVQSHFEVKDTGKAKYPGDDDRRPAPPFIFKARPRGSSGPFTISLLIQPGPPGHILGVVDMTKVHLAAPGAPTSPSQPPVASQLPPQAAPSAANQAPTPETPAASAPSPAASAPPADQPSGPTSDTPSGPITDSGGASSAQPSLQPPPDPAPTTH